MMTSRSLYGMALLISYLDITHGTEYYIHEIKSLPDYAPTFLDMQENAGHDRCIARFDTRPHFLTVNRACPIRAPTTDPTFIKRNKMSEPSKHRILLRRFDANAAGATNDEFYDNFLNREEDMDQELVII